MGYGRPSDRGLMVGRVSFVDVYKAEVGIALQRPIAIGDVVEVWVSRGQDTEKVDSLTVGEQQGPGSRCRREGSRQDRGKTA